MKILLLGLLPFICVVCAPPGECGNDIDLNCSSFRPVRPYLADAMPFTDGQELTYKFEGSASEIEAVAIVTEIMAEGRNTCDDRLSVGLRSQGPDNEVLAIMTTDQTGRDVISFGFYMTPDLLPFGETYELGYDSLQVPFVDFTLTSRIIGDTTIAGNNYQNVVVAIRPPEFGPTLIRSFYYSRTSGLLRVEFNEGPAFMLVE